MADIKTRDAVKGTIKTIDKAAIAGGRMKSAYAKTKDKSEHSYYTEGNSPAEYASDKITRTSGNVSEKGVRQFNKQGQKSVQITKKNIVKAKDKVSELKTKRAIKAANQRKAQTVAEQKGLAVSQRTTSHSPALDSPTLTYNNKSHILKSRQQEKKAIKTTVQNADTAVKSTAKGTIKTTKKSIKTSQTTSKAVIKTTKSSVKTAKTSAKTSQKAAQTAKTTAKATAKATKATVKAAIAAVRAIIASTKALISAIIAGGWIAIVIILIVVLLGCAVSLFGGGSESNSYNPISTEVEFYDPLIRQYAKQHGIFEYVELIKAVMMQESGGQGTDPMQASECGLNTRFPNTPNGITNPEYSINVGIQNLAACLKVAEVENPIDMKHIKLALQGYNFGNGYIAWAKKNYGGYSYANAIEFSKIQAKKLGWSSYGDTKYVANVLRYYPYGRAFAGGGNQEIVNVALSQLGNVGGKPYWSWYGCNSRIEWCACFVSWCADQCGYIDTGIIPKFSYCQTGADWFKEKGQLQSRKYEPSTGDIIFFDWNTDGLCDHVGIVEKCENGVVYTVEGNSDDACKQSQYSVGSNTIYGYGVPSY